MKPVRQTLHYPAASIHMLSREGDSLQRFLTLRNNKLSEEDIYFIKNFLGPSLIVHTLDLSASDPKGFYWVTHDDRCLLNLNLTGMRFGDFPDQEYAKNLLQTYSILKQDNKPQLSMEVINGDVPREFLRFMTMFELEGRGRQALVASSYEEIPNQVNVFDKMAAAAREKVRGSLSVVKRAREWAKGGTPEMNLDILKPISMGWDSAINDLFPGVPNDPLYIFLNS